MQEIAENRPSRHFQSDVFRDYRDVPCPVNFIRIAMDLDAMQIGQIIEVLLDEKWVVNVLNSLVRDGQTIVDKSNIDGYQAVLIRKTASCD
ncbi:MAG: sulfurtransferase TusA family protein [Chitinispirillaceae bacterium]|jgi:TusA-related sulfurtransferase